jgi:acyl-CoA thioesterase-1
VVLFVGTSLTAGPGIEPEETYPARIQEKMDSAGLRFRAVNAGVSGETAAGARRRLDWLMRQPFDVLVLETGSNDMLRGAAPSATGATIQAIIDRVRRDRPDVPIVLAGMMAVPNLGEEYGRAFRQMYVDLAERNRLTLVPFLLEGVGGIPTLNLPDGIHPNAEGHRRVAATVWRTLEPVLREEAAKPARAPADSAAARPAA